MAQAIHCDYEGHQDGLADVMVSRLENGETSAWCFDHYVDVCRAVVETVESTIRAAADQEAADRLAGIVPPPASDQEPDGPPGFPDELNRGPGFRPDGQPGGPEGDQSVQEGLGGPEAGEPGQPAPGATPDQPAQPGAPTDAPA